jgi:cell division septal protein FtsQ
MTHLHKSTIHKRPKKFFGLFGKHSPHDREIAKFIPDQRSLKSQTTKSRLNLRVDFLWHTIRQSEITFIMALAVALFFAFLFFHYFFMISKITVKDINGFPIQNWNLAGLDQIQGANMVLTLSSSIEKIVLNANPAVETVRVSKQFPQSIDIFIRLQKPIGFFRYSSVRYFILAGDGTLLQFSYERPEGLGEIRYYQSVSPGEYALGKPMGSRDVRFAARIGGLLVKYGMTKYVITIQDSHLITAQVGDFVIKAASDSDETKQLASLDQIIRIIQKGGEKIKSVDVRFEKIIVEK